MRNIDNELQTIANVYEALNTLTLSGYNQIKTNLNCMDALQSIYKSLSEVNNEIKASNTQEVNNNV